MPDSLQDLESRRADLVKQIAALGDLKDQGKTVTESLPTPATQKKAAREIAGFRHFEQLMRAFIEVNAKICRARSTEQETTSQEKKRRPRLAKKPPAN